MAFWLLPLALAALYVWLVAPGRGGQRMRCAPFDVPYAHRGLFDLADAPENSLPAFARAADAGYGIELDVQLTKDGQLIVFHDADTRRVCGRPGRLSRMTAGEAQSLFLGSSHEKMPLLSDVTALVQGRVPLMIELKSEHPFQHALRLPRAVNAQLAAYPGPVCVESFHPLMMGWFRLYAPDVPRGQLARYHNPSDPARFLMGQLVFNFLSRPQFISYGLGKRPFSMKIARLFHPAFVCWTVRSAREWQAVEPIYDQMIFEAFAPHHQKEGNDIHE